MTIEEMTIEELRRLVRATCDPLPLTSEPLEVFCCFRGQHAVCPDCGPVKVDEDGCCTACGADCEILNCWWLGVDRSERPGIYELVTPDPAAIKEHPNDD